jgi:hypothetical protein
VGLRGTYWVSGGGGLAAVLASERGGAGAHADGLEGPAPVLVPAVDVEDAARGVAGAVAGVAGAPVASGLAAAVAGVAASEAGSGVLRAWCLLRASVGCSGGRMMDA